MPFVNSLLLFAGLASAVCLPLFVGHGLSSHGTGWVLAGLGMGLLAAALLAVHVRLLRPRGGGSQRS